MLPRCAPKFAPALAGHSSASSSSSSPSSASVLSSSHKSAPFLQCHFHESRKGSDFPFRSFHSLHMSLNLEAPSLEKCVLLFLVLGCAHDSSPAAAQAQLCDPGTRQRWHSRAVIEAALYTLTSVTYSPCLKYLLLFWHLPSFFFPPSCNKNDTLFKLNCLQTNLSV